MKRQKTVSVKSNLTQAELFGVNEFKSVTTNEKGIGTLPDPYPSGEMLVYSQGKWKSTMEEQYRRFIKKCAAQGTYDHPTANPLPWHWDFTSAEIPVVSDANNVEVFRFEDGDDRDWANAELIVACVNKFAASISDEELDRMRKRQVYGDENHNDDTTIEERTTR